MGLATVKIAIPPPIAAPYCATSTNSAGRMRKQHHSPGGHDIYVDEKSNASAGDRILPETLPANPNPVLKEF